MSTPTSDTASYTFADDPDDMTDGLGDRVLLGKIDMLRELNVHNLIPLPQIVAVGDQSSGKSSVLENLTGFSFPRSVSLCTRYATQITCRRDPQKEVTVTIIPQASAPEARKKQLRAFKGYATDLAGSKLAEVFEKANRAMGIRPSLDSNNGDTSANNDYQDLRTFSEDILKIEICGPNQSNLTVIDVPGIFRRVTEGLTTESDIPLVHDMVQRYMADPRTIILTISPCNVDVATQEIFDLARKADPSGVRTMGVLTKPDLAQERATQQAVIDLVLGRTHDLHLGYCVVKNRGADDKESSLASCRFDEKQFFSRPPWSTIASLSRTGIDSLKQRLRELLMDVTRREFPKVKAEINRMLEDDRKTLNSMGPSRSDSNAQRMYLGKMASQFEKLVGSSLNAYYTEDPIFTERMDLRLITRIIELNESFSKVFAERAHTRNFQSTQGADSGDPKDEEGSDDEGPEDSYGGLPLNAMPNAYPELCDIISDKFVCARPCGDPLMDHIESVFKKSRGPELGTFGGAMLGTTFKEQSKKWEPLVLSHISKVIMLVHHFVVGLLEVTFREKQVREEFWENILLDRLRSGYAAAMKHAHFLLRLEREGKPVTYNKYFDSNLQRCRLTRLGENVGSVHHAALDEHERDYPANWCAPRNERRNKKVTMDLLRLEEATVDKSNAKQVREDIHDILESYYSVSRERFVDVVCQQVIFHLLLEGPDAPLRVVSSDLVMGLSESQLDSIAGEDAGSRRQRQVLKSKITSLEAAVRVLRS